MTRTCPACGMAFAPPYRDKRVKYCSRRCASIGSALAKVGKLAEVVCATCRTPFPPSRRDQRFCSERCRRAAFRDSTTHTCSEPECDRPLRARGMCSMHWRRWARATGAEHPPAWDDQRKARYQERRARKAQVPSEEFSPSEVYERDQWRCGICGQPVDPALAYPDPHSPSLDHVVPLSAGGAHSRANTQCSHLRCNLSKGVTVA